MPDEWGGVEIEDEFGGVLVEDEPAPEDRPLERESADFAEPEIPRPTFTMFGKEYPIPDQANRPPMPRAVSDFAGLPPETSRAQDLKEALPGPGEFAKRVMEPTGIEGAGQGVTALMTTTPEELKAQMAEAPEFRRMGEQLGAIQRPEVTPFAASDKPTTGAMTPIGEVGGRLAEPPEIPESVIFDTALQNELAKGVEELTTGENQAIMVGTMGAGSIPKIGHWLQRAVSGYFGYEGARAVQDAAKQLREATTPEGKAQAWAGIIKGAAIAVPATLHAVRPPPVPRPIETIIAKTEAAVPGALNKSIEALKKVEKPADKTSVETKPTEVTDASKTPEAESQPAAPTQESAVAREPARAEAGQEREVLLAGERPGGTTPRDVPLTGPEVIKSIVDLPDAEAGKLKQRPAVEAGTKLTPADVPALEAARDLAGKTMLEALEKGEDVKFQAEYGKNIWFSGAIEGANRKGPNYDVFAKEQAAAKPAPTTETPGVTAEIPARQAPVVEPGVGAVPENVSGAGAQTQTTTGSGRVDPALAEVGPGMGGALKAEPPDARAQLAQLTDSIATLAAEGKAQPAKAFSLGETLSKAKDSATAALDGLKAAGSYMKLKLEGKPTATEYKGVLGDRHLALSESSVNARKWVQSVKKAVPDPKVREAISNWVDSGGDPALLTKAAGETKAQYKAGYERAQKLTPEEKVVAENLRNYFDSRLQEAIDAGVLEDGIENYIHRIYEQESPWKKGVIQELRSGLFTGKPALAKQRVFEYDFEAEKAGKKPIKDFAKRVVAYDLALNKAIADRAAVKGMMEIKMGDGRPMIDVGGGGKVIENAAGEPQATIINRSSKKIDPNDTKANRGDYKPFDHPALRKWKWATEDTAGKPVFVQGDVLIHPEAIGDINKLLGRSAIRQNPVGRAALNVSSTIKQTMLDLSGFHPVQIAVHGTEHRTFAPVKEIDFTNPDVRGLIRGGAAVGETSGHAAFSEGLSGGSGSLTKHIPWAGERLQAYNSWLFEDYIPRLKVAMGLHALERNRARFKDLSPDQQYELTANQMNAAFGEQNYTMLGRSKTTQDALRLALLAPDFLEARSRFVAQAFTKYGAEQRQALLLGAATMYITARLINKMLDDEYHFEPKNAFNVVYGGKSYGLRTVQGDLIHAVTEPGKFINHRLNPVFGKPALEFVTGRDYFGRKRTVGEQLKDFAKTPVPIGVRGAFENQEQTLFESFLNSFGLVTKRDSASSDISKLAADWRKENKISTGPGEFIYDADKDPFRDIKLAAERGDEAGVRSEVAKAMNAGLKRSRILEHFKLSATHYFAGSAANEKKFIASLTEDQKKIYQDALAERKRIRETVRRAGFTP